MERYVLFTLAVLLLVFGSSAADCITGNIRLDDGILKICNNTVWRSVCSEDWGNLDAAVACKQLGYDGGYTVNARFRSSPLNPVAYRCNGTENNLQNCDRRSYGGCSYGVNVTCVRKNSSDSCNSGDIRLWGGRNRYEGNIELCTERGIWSTISDISWSNAEAVVACRQLGYANSIAVPICCSTFGQRFEAMEYGGMSCRGYESSLLDCGVQSTFVDPFSDFFFSNQRDYAGVRCTPRKARPVCNNGAVRLANGYSNNNGFAEICVEGDWIGICKADSFRKYYDDFDEYGTSMASLICNQLGYQRFTNIDKSFFASNISEPLAYVRQDDRCFRDFYRYDRFHSQPQTRALSALDCIANYTYSGIPYIEFCDKLGILCCPNDTTTCFIGGSPTLPATPPENPTIQPSSTPSTENPTIQPSSTPSTVTSNEASFTLHFGSAATSLILANSADLRGLKKDIRKKVKACLDEEKGCSKSTLSEGFLSIGENIQYKSHVDFSSCVGILQRCLEENPWMQYHSTDLYLNIEF